jgi:hypothetical protein
VITRDVSGEDVGGKIRIVVVKVEDGAVTIRRERLDADGSVSESGEIEIKLPHSEKRLQDLQDKAKQISRERLIIKDREFAVTAISWDGDEGEVGTNGAVREFKVWVSEELPVGGIAKTWSSDPDFPAFEVIDYGF